MLVFLLLLARTLSPFVRENQRSFSMCVCEQMCSYVGAVI